MKFKDWLNTVPRDLYFSFSASLPNNKFLLISCFVSNFDCHLFWLSFIYLSFCKWIIILIQIYFCWRIDCQMRLESWRYLKKQSIRCITNDVANKILRFQSIWIYLFIINFNKNQDSKINKYLFIIIQLCSKSLY